MEGIQCKTGNHLGLDGLLQDYKNFSESYPAFV